MAHIEPTLDDDGVMDFIALGYVVLEGVIGDDFNRRCLDQPGGNANDFIGGEDFTQNVLLHPQVAEIGRAHV